MYRVIIARRSVPIPQIAGYFRSPIAAQAELDRLEVAGEVEVRTLVGWERLEQAR